MLPSGIVRKNKISIIGNGVVVDPWALLDEIEEIKSKGVDVNVDNIKEYGIPLKGLYGELNKSKAKKITIFLDACFSGGGRDESLLASRGIVISPKQDKISGNMVLFASSSGDERSLPYINKSHGIFTYFLLKHLQKTKGKTSYKECENSVSYTHLTLPTKA